MTKYCKCGCGEEIIIKTHHKHYGIPDYCWGHNISLSINSPESLEKRNKRMKENNPMKNPIIAKKNALKRKGIRRTKEQKKNISVGVKEAMERPEVKEKMSYTKSEKHKGKLSKALMGNQSAKGHKWTDEQKNILSESLKGNQRKKGTYCSKESKKRMGLASKKKWQNPKFREKRLNALHKHHIYLDDNDEKILMLTSSKHLQLHSKTYEYLVEINVIDDYIKWFERKYGLSREEK